MWNVSRSVMSDSLWPHGLGPARLFCREYWSGLPFPSPGDLPDPGIGPVAPALQADPLSCKPPGKLKPIDYIILPLIPSPTPHPLATHKVLTDTNTNGGPVNLLHSRTTWMIWNRGLTQATLLFFFFFLNTAFQEFEVIVNSPLPLDLWSKILFFPLLM